MPPLLQPAPAIQVAYDPRALRFSGESALVTLETFVQQFPHRHSGAPNSRRATEWLRGAFEARGWRCELDEWEVTLYGRPVMLHNVIARLAGISSGEIVLVAHHDQSPCTVQGADNDGSGIAILLHLADIFSRESTPPYTLTLLASDGEEYGMLGARRFVATHRNPGNIVAAFSLDNLGKHFYDRMEMSPIGQFRNYGPLWLQLLARESARAAGDLWLPRIRTPLEELLDQAVPISFMDQGPFVAAGVPALGFAGHVPPQAVEEHYRTYHSPEDSVAIIAAESLQQSGRIAEAAVRQLLTMRSFPRERGPYLFFKRLGILRGVPLYLLFTAFVALFFLGSYLAGNGPLSSRLAGSATGLPHFLALWLPLFGSTLLLRLLAAAHVIPKFELYPAPPKDPLLTRPIWLAVALYLAGLLFLLLAGRYLTGQTAITPAFGDVKSLALLVVGLGATYFLIVNPFSLLFFTPLLFWFLIGGQTGVGLLLNSLFFLLGGSFLFAVLYFFGFRILRIGFHILWYLMLMFSSGMIGLPTAAFSTAVLAAGLSLILSPL